MCPNDISRALCQRHTRAADYTINTCRKNVQLNPRRVATFDRAVSPAYWHLLEGIAMVIFGSYQDVGVYHNRNSLASCKLTVGIRASLQPANISWGGYNAAWSLFQGLSNVARRFDTSCGNTVCSRIVIWRQTRMFLDPTDPLGSYICKPCHRFRQRHGALPDAEDAERSQELSTTRAISKALRGQFPLFQYPCQNCGRPECCSWKPTEVNLITWFRTAEAHSNRLICKECTTG